MYIQSINPLCRTNLEPQVGFSGVLEGSLIRKVIPPELQRKLENKTTKSAVFSAVDLGMNKFEGSTHHISGTEGSAKEYFLINVNEPKSIERAVKFMISKFRSPYKLF